LWPNYRWALSRSAEGPLDRLGAIAGRDDVFPYRCRRTFTEPAAYFSIPRTPAFATAVLPMLGYQCIVATVTTHAENDMKERLTVVTRKGQITIPAEIRRALGIKEGDKVALVMDDNEARLTRTGSVVQRTAGALKSRRPPLTAKQLREAAERAVSEEAVERA